MHRMKATIDEAGRLTLPREIRDAAGLAPGTELEVRVRDGVIELEPQTLPVRFDREGHLVVAVPLIPVQPITVEMVNELLDEMRRRREGLD